MDEQKTFYVTKYALTAGIMAVRGEISKTNPNMLCYTTDDGKYTQYAHSKDWNSDLDEAITDCERRRETKIKSLKKQIAKLEKMEFKL